MDHRINDVMETAVETIAAISTPPGEGGIGIIRLSGPQAVQIAGRVFRRADGRPLVDPQPFHQYYGHVIDPVSHTTVDEVLLSVMHAPRSYTQEDMAEISGHGGQLPLNAVLALVCAQGARLAMPGEFTQRAFLNGRIDLTQAEAVLDTIRARTDAGLRAAQHVLHGELGRQVTALRTRLVGLLASLEAAIDYAEEDITLLSAEELTCELASIREAVAALIASHTQGKLLREGASTVIIGRPNTGKSSLLNALLGEARAIVTPVPGTTRDVIEEQVNIGGIPLRLIDTAGICRTDDLVEQIGVARSRDSLAQADLILLVLDRTQPLAEEDRELLAAIAGRPAIVALNKADLHAALSTEDVAAHTDAQRVEVSALTGSGLDQLKQVLRELLLGPTIAVESPLLANERQRQAAVRAQLALDEAASTLQKGGTEELIAVDVMEAATALGEITGENIRDEIIHDLFSRFCIGK